MSEGIGSATERWSHWPFAVGERVRASDDWGILICDMSVRAKDNPNAEYVIDAVADDGRWLRLRDDEGNFYPSLCGCPATPAYGPSYFRIVGECLEHFPGYDYDVGMFRCSRCDALLPEASSRYWMRPQCGHSATGACRECNRRYWRDNQTRKRAAVAVTPFQREALAMLRREAERGREPHGVVSADRTSLIDDQPWVHYSTARALERRGLVKITYYPPDGAEITLEAREAALEQEGKE